MTSSKAFHLLTASRPLRVDEAVRPDLRLNGQQEQRIGG